MQTSCVHRLFVECIHICSTIYETNPSYVKVLVEIIEKILYKYILYIMKDIKKNKNNSKRILADLPSDYSIKLWKALLKCLTCIDFWGAVTALPKHWFLDDSREIINTLIFYGSWLWGRYQGMQAVDHGSMFLPSYLWGRSIMRKGPAGFLARYLRQQR